MQGGKKCIQHIRSQAVSCLRKPATASFVDDTVVNGRRVIVSSRIESYVHTNLCTQQGVRQRSHLYFMRL